MAKRLKIRGARVNHSVVSRPAGQPPAPDFCGKQADRVAKKVITDGHALAVRLGAWSGHARLYMVLSEEEPRRADSIPADSSE